MKTLNKYNLETYLLPIQKSDIIYHESILFVGKEEGAPLLFDLENIISVRSADLKTEYVLGKDYIVKDNKIYLTENTSIPYFTEEQFFPSEPYDAPILFECSLPNKKYLYFGEGGTFITKQVMVTYTHKPIKDFPFIKDYSDRFTKTISKLKNKEKIKVLFYGDSITVGANSSKLIGVEPHAETWTEMITSFLKSKFNVEIDYVNTAVGGKTTEWGVENVDNLVNKYNPDLLFIGFGMNNGRLTNEEYYNLIKQICDSAKANNPNVEIMLVSSILPNAMAKGVFGNQQYYENALIELAEKENYGVATITTIHKYLLKVKRYFDMTGNNINHPNDFMARVYAQTILTALLGADYYE